MEPTPIDDKIRQRRRELKLWRGSIEYRRRRVEQLEQSVKQMFLDLAEEEKDLADEEGEVGGQAGEPTATGTAHSPSRTLIAVHQRKLAGSHPENVIAAVAEVLNEPYEIELGI
jgi:hypothetical protein